MPVDIQYGAMENGTGASCIYISVHKVALRGSRKGVFKRPSVLCTPLNDRRPYLDRREEEGYVMGSAVGVGQGQGQTRVQEVE